MNETVRAALDAVTLADLIDPSQLFPVAASEKAEIAPHLVPAGEDEAYGRNH